MLENEMLKKELTEEELALLDKEMDRLRKEVNVAYVVWLLGFFGLHKFYLGKFGMGILYFFTGGLFIIGWLFYDSVTLPRQVYEYNAKVENDIIRQLFELRKRHQKPPPQ